MKLRYIVSTLLAAGLTTAFTCAQPLMVNYQGRLSQLSGALFPNGPADVRVRLFDAATGGTQVWDSGIQTVQVRDGVFSLLLQGGTPSLSSAQFIPGLRYFEISVRQGANWTTLSPRQVVTSAPWAFVAGTVPDGAIGTAKLADGAVTSAKLLDSVVTTAKLADGSVTGAKLSNNSVGSVHLIDLAVTTAKVADGAVTISKLSNDSVGTLNLVNLAVTGPKIALNAVGTDQLAVGAVWGNRVLDGAITNAKIADGSIANAKLGSNAVTSSKLASDPGSMAKVSGNALTIGSGGSIEIFSPTPLIDFHFNSTAADFNYRIVNIADGVLGFENTGGRRVTFTNGGRVGVGTDSPSHLLHVAGAGRIGGNLTVDGSVTITGSLSKGSGSFLIDHPLDPYNKTLSHSFVESPDMMNIYNGNVVTDKRGEAWVTLPSYFHALNVDFRYQLTVIGEFAQAIIGKKIKDRRFLIRTDKPNVEVSWQVTGIRNDTYARENRIKVEQEKTGSAAGKLLYDGRKALAR